MQNIAVYLNATITEPIDVKQANTSFTNKKRKFLSQTELFICEKIIGNEALEDNGYETGQGSFRLVDIPEFIYISFRFVIFQTIRVFKTKSALVSILYFIRTTFSSRRK